MIGNFRKLNSLMKTKLLLFTWAVNMRLKQIRKLPCSRLAPNFSENQRILTNNFFIRNSEIIFIKYTKNQQ